ncbi:MAG: hypothetical protein ACE14P_10410 [Methanotrichaceae archaeon]
MRNILAITIALMFAAAMLSPAIGFTFQSGGNQSYSIGSTPVNYSISMGEPAQNFTPNMIPAAATPKPAVTVATVSYSINLGGASPYSMKLPSGSSVAPQGLATMPATVALGSIANS